MGDRHIHAKTLSGLGTYRLIYTVEMGEYIFVLHAFQKKSKSGIATPKKDIDTIQRRLKEAEVLYKELKGVR